MWVPLGGFYFCGGGVGREEMIKGKRRRRSRPREGVWRQRKESEEKSKKDREQEEGYKRRRKRDKEGGGRGKGVGDCEENSIEGKRDKENKESRRTSSENPKKPYL